jgi:hypothetical protein
MVTVTVPLDAATAILQAAERLGLGQAVSSWPASPVSVVLTFTDQSLGEMLARLSAPVSAAQPPRVLRGGLDDAS